MSRTKPSMMSEKVSIWNENELYMPAACARFNAHELCPYTLCVCACVCVCVFFMLQPIAKTLGVPVPQLFDALVSFSTQSEAVSGGTTWM